MGPGGAGRALFKGSLTEMLWSTWDGARFVGPFLRKIWMRGSPFSSRDFMTLAIWRSMPLPFICGGGALVPTSHFICSDSRPPSQK